jgi:hypothetical protein
MVPGLTDNRSHFALSKPDGLRAKDICRMLNTGLQPRHTESMRAKLKRLVGHGILIEPEPGLFALPRANHRA